MRGKMKMSNKNNNINIMENKQLLEELRKIQGKEK